MPDCRFDLEKFFGTQNGVSRRKRSRTGTRIIAMAEISRRHPGRPSLGERTQLKIRVFHDIRAASRQRAKFYGLTETDYIAALIAADAGLEGRAPQLCQGLDSVPADSDDSKGRSTTDAA